MCGLGPAVLVGADVRRGDAAAPADVARRRMAAVRGIDEEPRAPGGTSLPVEVDTPDLVRTGASMPADDHVRDRSTHAEAHAAVGPQQPDDVVDDERPLAPRVPAVPVRAADAQRSLVAVDALDAGQDRVVDDLDETR